ncbi:MAG: hypothetical protein HY326_10680 [Chloroflexi bacterium]|nr:hypothetical protein [Chloroflexota bacterium]
MNTYVKVVLFGILTWLVAFVVSVAIFPLKTAQYALFETIMSIIVTISATLFAILYFRKVKERSIQAGILVGVTWFLINLAIDLPLFLLGGPMQMSFGDYMAEIGLEYLMIPTVTVGFGILLQQRAT